jgi:hypothetical protein
LAWDRVIANGSCESKWERLAESTDNAQPGSFPRFWRLFSYCLPRPVRDRYFEPAYNDLLQDYLETRGTYRTIWAKRWLKFYYTLHTVRLVGGCLWGWLVNDKLFGLLCRLLPPWLAYLFRQFFRLP